MSFFVSFVPSVVQKTPPPPHPVPFSVSLRVLRGEKRNTTTPHQFPPTTHPSAPTPWTTEHQLGTPMHLLAARQQPRPPKGPFSLSSVVPNPLTHRPTFALFGPFVVGTSPQHTCDFPCPSVTFCGKKNHTTNTRDHRAPARYRYAPAHGSAAASPSQMAFFRVFRVFRGSENSATSTPRAFLRVPPCPPWWKKRDTTTHQFPPKPRHTPQPGTTEHQLGAAMHLPTARQQPRPPKCPFSVSSLPSVVQSNVCLNSAGEFVTDLINSSVPCRILVVPFHPWIADRAVSLP